MARYDYHCPSCGEVFEVEHPMGAKPEISCPRCGARAERVFDPSAITFSGTGFYNTDMRDSPKATKDCAGCAGDCSSCA